ncbi:hypothetical protein HNV11_12725 [Spirosoma taeanense]|uniref:Uncharacterized protein n=1 Tax=Spirosoma taeanense TaxID=2735870 RepID=A0A6M5Y706_9BACT|nr:hypothetical protein [Spirosoma taeanense]QJW90177.1 hypothetical protein HNV11_12725 [Spirosoma taeanense]
MSRFVPSVYPATNSPTFWVVSLDWADALALPLTLPVTILADCHAETKSVHPPGRTRPIYQLGTQINTSHLIRLPNQFTVEITAWFASPPPMALVDN